MQKPNLEKMYSEYNADLFGGALPVLPVSWNARLRKSLGRCRFKRVKAGYTPVGIDIQYPYASERQLRKTLVHEMCHVWACLEKGETAHGPWFWLKMEACGYPDGHRFPNAGSFEIDAYDDARKNYNFTAGQRVVFQGRKGEDITGKIIRVNKRTITVRAGRFRYRVPPSRLLPA